VFLFILKYSLNQVLLYNKSIKTQCTINEIPTDLKVIEELDRYRNRPETCRFQWPRGLRRRSSAARLLRLWVKIPPRGWMFICC